MRIHTYVVQHDKGFAPNPFWGFCTLACCKPRIRNRAAEGDIVMGFGSASKEVGLSGRVIYWMKVGKIISFDTYWSDPKYASKKPAMQSGLMACYGDNIYHSDGNGWRQTISFHSDGAGLGSGNLERDTSLTDRVLIGQDFAYWGGNAPLLPKALGGLVPALQTERCNYSEADKAKILAWIASRPERGFRAPPADWARDHAPSPRKIGKGAKTRREQTAC
jgi:hypothetical protein